MDNGKYIVFLNDRKTRFVCEKIVMYENSVGCIIYDSKEHYTIPWSSIWYVKTPTGGE